MNFNISYGKPLLEMMMQNKVNRRLNTNIEGQMRT